MNYKNNIYYGLKFCTESNSNFKDEITYFGIKRSYFFGDGSLLEILNFDKEKSLIFMKDEPTITSYFYNKKSSYVSRKIFFNKENLPCKEQLFYPRNILKSETFFKSKLVSYASSNESKYYYFVLKKHNPHGPAKLNFNKNSTLSSKEYSLLKSYNTDHYDEYGYESYTAFNLPLNDGEENCVYNHFSNLQILK